MSTTKQPTAADGGRKVQRKMAKGPESKVMCTEDQLQVAEDCKKMLEATGCDYMVCIFPTEDGGEELVKAKISTPNMAAHFNSIAEKTAKRLGITREKALISMAAVGSMTKQSIELD